MYKIGTLNKISPVGLARLTYDYTVVEDVAEANGIILRSYDCIVVCQTCQTNR